MSDIHIINTCKALSLIQSEQGHRQHLVSLRRDRTLYKEPGFPALERERRSFAVSASSSSVSARRLFQPARRLFQQARRLFQLVVCFSSSSVSARRLFQLARRLFQLVVCFSKLVVCFSSSSVLARRLFQLVLVVCFSKLVVCFSKLVVCFSKLVVCVLARRLFQQARRLFQPARCLFKQARRLFKLVDEIITEQDEQQVQEKDGPNQIRKLLAILPSKGSAQHSGPHDQNSHADSKCDQPTVSRPTRRKGERVFIVHAGEDKDSFVRPLVQTLQDKGFPKEDIFYDELSISTGEVIRDRIMSALASDRNVAESVGDAGSSMTPKLGHFVADELPNMSQSSTQAGPTRSASLSSTCSGSIESMGNQLDAAKTAATVPSGVMSVGQNFTQPGPSMSPLQGFNEQSSVQSGFIRSPMEGGARDDCNFPQRIQGETCPSVSNRGQQNLAPSSGVDPFQFPVEKKSPSQVGTSRSAHEVSGDLHHQVGKRQYTSKPDSPSMSPSRLLDIDIDVAVEIVVASIISDEWRTLLHHLGLSEQELETLQNKETPEVACEAGLKLWRETRGQEVTAERLVKAVKDTKVKLRNGTACKDGTLSAILTEEYITQELVETCGGMSLYVHIEVDEADFQRGMHFFHEEDSPGHGGQLPHLYMCSVGQGGGPFIDIQQHQVEPMDTQDSPTVHLIPDPTGSDSMEESVHPAVLQENQWSTEPMEVKVEPMGAELEEAFEIVSKDLWSDWERLAHAMGFTQSDVDSIKSASPDQLYEQCWKLLYRWSHREGQKATLQALTQQLRVAGFHGTAEKLGIGDMSDQDEHGASKKTSDDSEASSDSDSDSDGDDDSMKGAALPSKLLKMKPLKMGKRRVPNPQQTAGKGVKKKKMIEEDDDVEMVEETGVSRSDNTEQAEVATDDLCFMLTPADIKRWQEAMKTHVEPDRIASLEEQFRFNMLVMHLIKDEVQLSRQGKVLYSVQTEEGENPHRMALDLTCAGNYNITHNIRALAVVLPVGHRVQQADVEKLKLGQFRPRIGDEGVGLLAEMFCYLPRLKHLDLSYSGITPTGARALAVHMSHLQQLEWLDLSGNYIGEDGTTAMNEMLPQLEKLKCLNLTTDGVSVDMRKSLLLTLSMMEHLSEVNLRTQMYCSYVYLLGVYNNQGQKLTILTDSKSDVVSLVDEVFSQVYRVQLSYDVKLLYSVQTEEGENPHRMTLDLTCAGDITKNIRALAVVLPVGHCVQQADVEELKLGRSDIGDEEVRLLAEMFCYLPRLKHLDLSNNFLTPTSVTALAEHLSHLQQLEQLDLSVYNNQGHKLTIKTDFESDVVSLVDEVLSEVYRVELSYQGNVLYSVQTEEGENPHRMTLDLTCAGNITEHIQALAAVLPVGHRVQQADVEELKLGSSGIRDVEVFSKLYRLELSCQGEVLYSVQTEEGENPHRMTLDLTCAGDITKNIRALTVVLPVGHRVQQADVEELKLGSSGIGDEGVYRVELSCQGKVLYSVQTEEGENPRRMTLDLTCAGNITQNIQALAVVLPVGHRVQQADVEELKLGGSYIRDEEVYRVQLSYDVKLLYSVQTEEGENPHRMTLDLTCAGNITKNIRALAVVLPVGHRVQQADVEELKLGSSGIGDEGVRLLAEMFCYLPRLKHLDLSYSGITPTSARVLAAHMSHLQQLEWLDLSNNFIGDDGVTALADNFCFIQKLKHLDLSHNKITSTGATAVAAHMPHLQQLEWFDLSVNDIGLTAVNEKLLHLQQMKYFKM
ncbi:hypothetical protein Bbelb_363060 [Branchiostoma belcheri]|nr:hypothetical protein Bbelb_363060 [Branchiostoma belcheri]